MKNKRDVPKLNKENFPAWQTPMKLHISSISDVAVNFLRTEYVEVTTTSLIVEELRQKLNHNQAMLDIASALSYVEFDDLKDCNNAKKMWDKLKTIYGGDDNVLRAKEKILKGKFDDMRMMEGENIIQYCTRDKEVVNSTQGKNGTIEDEQ